jgi:hypothetical protein
MAELKQKTIEKLISLQNLKGQEGEEQLSSEKVIIVLKTCAFIGGCQIVSALVDIIEDLTARIF